MARLNETIKAAAFNEAKRSWVDVLIKISTTYKTRAKANLSTLLDLKRGMVGVEIIDAETKQLYSDSWTWMHSDDFDHCKFKQGNWYAVHNIPRSSDISFVESGPAAELNEKLPSKV